MNTYIIPIWDLDNEPYPENIIINARNMNDCEDKLMQQLIVRFDSEDCGDYEEFRKLMDSKYNVGIGEITDKDCI